MCRLLSTPSCFKSLIIYVLLRLFTFKVVVLWLKPLHFYVFLIPTEGRGCHFVSLKTHRGLRSQLAMGDRSRSVVTLILQNKHKHLLKTSWDLRLSATVGLGLWRSWEYCRNGVCYLSGCANSIGLYFVTPGAEWPARPLNTDNYTEPFTFSFMPKTGTREIISHLHSYYRRS